MSRDTKAARAERDEAIARLREWVKPGDTVYTILDHVSSSGMSRAIRVVVPVVRHEVKDGDHWRALGGGEIAGDRAVREVIDHLHPNWAVGKALGMRHRKINGRESDALVVGGCGMDMGFHLVNSLSQILYGGRLSRDIYMADAPTLHKDGTGPLLTRGQGAPDGEVWIGGYRCLGKGCPSNYHANHRDRIRCEGTRVYNPDGPDTGHYCRRPERYGRFADDAATIAAWPTRAIPLEGGEVYEMPASAVPEGEGDDARMVVCPTCGGAGDLANPEGPERFDLVHMDGYALRHRWL